MGTKVELSLIRRLKELVQDLENGRTIIVNKDGYFDQQLSKLEYIKIPWGKEWTKFKKW